MSDQNPSTQLLLLFFTCLYHRFNNSLYREPELMYLVYTYTTTVSDLSRIILYTTASTVIIGKVLIFIF